MNKVSVEVENESWLVQSEKTYFASDGNYGSADGMALIDTSKWSEDDWSEIELAGDAERVQVALDLTQRKD